jgi:hypothetical protein
MGGCGSRRACFGLASSDRCGALAFTKRLNPISGAGGTPESGPREGQVVTSTIVPQNVGHCKPPPGQSVGMVSDTCVVSAAAC